MHSSRVLDISLLTPSAGVPSRCAHPSAVSLSPPLLRVGALQVGDQVLAIDDVNLEHVSAAEASRLLQSSAGPLLRLEIVPVTPRRASDAKRCKGRWGARQTGENSVRGGEGWGAMSGLVKVFLLHEVITGRISSYMCKWEGSGPDKFY